VAAEEEDMDGAAAAVEVVEVLLIRGILAVLVAVLKRDILVILQAVGFLARLAAPVQMEAVAAAEEEDTE